MPLLFGSIIRVAILNKSIPLAVILEHATRLHSN